MKHLNVLLVFGGESPEHDVSIMSAHNVYAAMDHEKYTVNLCYIDKKGKWWLLNEWTEDMAHHGGVQLAAVPGTESFITIPGSAVIHVDVLFPVLHGKNGEDGTVQGLAEMLHIPYVGCNIESSALCMDKHAAKQVLRSHEVSVTDWQTFTKYENATQRLQNTEQDIRRNLGEGPWFVKPSRAGSSVGVTKVRDYEKLEAAIEEALRYDVTALVEPAVIGRELEVAVLGNSPDVKSSGVGEIITGAEFYDYDDKYSPTSTSKTTTNADLDDEQRSRIQKAAIDAYNALGCSGLARVDFLMSQDGTVYLNEVNTMPGFTNISMYPKLWQEQGMKYPHLIDKLIQLALK